LLLFVVVVVFATVVMGGKKVTVGILAVGWLVLARYARGMYVLANAISTDRQTPRQCEEPEKLVRVLELRCGYACNIR
jgi:hypothetical protein